MKASDFDFELDPLLIAQTPIEPRDAARLLVAQRDGSLVRHLHVRDLPSVLQRGDLLVVNDTRVLAVRLFGRRASGAEVEVLLAQRLGPCRWRALVQPAGRLKPGERLELEGGIFVAHMLERPRAADGSLGDWLLELSSTDSGQEFDLLLEAHGHLPLPRYIERARSHDPREAQDRERYQTVYARTPGAIAAPTAGLHFTPQLLARLEQAGIELARVTLHVGEGTFKPVEVEDIEQHRMHAEDYVLPSQTAASIQATRARGGRVIAVGTTSARTLETCARAGRCVDPGSGSTRLFLKPGEPLRVVDGLFTNFHLPRSTLLMLVSAFAGREKTLDLYAQALRERYRFYSFGDAMLIL